ncbi:MAG: BON domain-containing protein [Pseudomonadota bacterium]
MKKLSIALVTCLGLSAMGVAQAEKGLPSEREPMMQEPSMQSPTDSSTQNQSMPTQPEQMVNDQDIAVANEIRQEIKQDEKLSSAMENVEITAVNKTLTITGTVEDDADRERILAAVEKHSADYEIVDQLEVNS